MTDQIHPEITLSIKDHGDQPGKANVHLLLTEAGVEVAFHDKDGGIVADVFVELCDGKLRLHAWDEKDEGNDPTVSLTLVEDVQKALEPKAE